MGGGGLGGGEVEEGVVGGEVVAVVDAGYVVEESLLEEGVAVAGGSVSDGLGKGGGWETYMLYMRMFRDMNVVKLTSANFMRELLKKLIARSINPFPPFFIVDFDLAVPEPICSSSNHQIIDGA